MRRMGVAFSHHRALLGGLLGLLLCQAALVSANMGGGSSRIPLTDWIIELYNVTNNVYVPMICLGAVVLAAFNLLFGVMRFGQVFVRTLGVIGLLGLGVTWFAQTIGANIAVALVG